MLSIVRAGGEHSYHFAFSVKRIVMLRYIIPVSMTHGNFDTDVEVSEPYILLFFLNNQSDAVIIQIYSVIKLYTFRASSLSIIRSFLLCIRHWPLPSRVRTFHPDSAWKRSSKTCMKLTGAERTVENSWWWAEKMPETCRVL